MPNRSSYRSKEEKQLFAQYLSFPCNSSERNILNGLLKTELLRYHKEMVFALDPSLDIESGIIIPGISETFFSHLSVKKKLLMLNELSFSRIWELIYRSGIKCFINELYKNPITKLTNYATHNPRIPRGKNERYVTMLLKNPSYIVYYDEFSTKTIYVFQDEVLKTMRFNSSKE